MIAYIAHFAYSAKFTKSLRKVCAVLTIYTLRIVRYDKVTTKKAADQGKEENTMKELFREEYKDAEERLYNKGFYVDNMEFFDDEFEVSNADGKILIDHLSLAQLKQLSEML